MKNTNFEIRVYHACGYKNISPDFYLRIDKDGMLYDYHRGTQLGKLIVPSSMLQNLDSDHIDILIDGAYRDEPTEGQLRWLNSLCMREYAGRQSVTVNLYIQGNVVKPLFSLP